MRGTKRGWTRVAFAAAVTIVVASVGTVAGTAIARSAPGISNAPAPCVSAGTPYNHVRMNPGPIALAGSLQSGQSVAWFAQALDGTLCVPGATIWMQIVSDVSGDSVTVSASQCGGQTQLSYYYAIPCVADATGKVYVTYTAPNPIPDKGTVQINGMNASSHASVTGVNWYLYEYVFQFSTSPMGPSGGLAPGQQVPETLQVSGVGGTPTLDFPVWLSFTSTASQPGSVLVGTTLLTSTPEPFYTDGSASIQMVYTAPSSPPTSGIDTLYAESYNGSSPAISAVTQYDFAAGDPIISVGDEAQVEGDAAPDILAQFDVTLSAPQTVPVTVQYLTVCGIGDKTCKEDYLQSLEPTPHTVTFKPGQVSAHILIKMYSYKASEPYNEGLFIQLINPDKNYANPAGGVVLGRSLAQGTLLGDDETTLNDILYIGDTGVVCSTSGTQFAEFTVTLSSPESTPVTFNYATQDGSAVAGTDYYPTSGTATIPPGSTSFHIQVTVLAQTVAASAKTYMVNLTNVSAGTTVERPTGVGTILNWTGV